MGHLAGAAAVGVATTLGYPDPRRPQGPRPAVGSVDLRLRLR